MSEPSGDEASTSSSEEEKDEQNSEDLWVFSESEFESFSDAEGADENGLWQVDIIGEEVDGQGNVRYEAAWRNWSRPDGSNTTWDNALLHPTDISLWKRKQTARRNQLARESLDIEIWPDLDIENTATRLREQAYEEKLAIRKRNPVRLEEQMNQLLAEKKALAGGDDAQPVTPSGLRSGRSFTREGSTSTSASGASSLRYSRPPASTSSSSNNRRGRTVDSTPAQPSLFTPTPEPELSPSPFVSTFEMRSTAQASTATSTTSASTSASVSASTPAKGHKRSTRSWSSDRSYQPRAAPVPSDTSLISRTNSATPDLSEKARGKQRAIDTSPRRSITSRDRDEAETEDLDHDGRSMSSVLGHPALYSPAPSFPLRTQSPPSSATLSSQPKPSSPSRGTTNHTSAFTRRKLEQEWTARAQASGAAPITLSNEVDEEVPSLPQGFRYLESEYLYSNKVPRVDDEDVFVRCECGGGNESQQICVAGVCNCQEPSELVDEEGNKVFAYTPEGLFTFNVPQGIEVIECNDYCRCDVSKCPNRVAQRPRDFVVDVFKTLEYGWGVRSPVDIERGKVLGLYTGLLIRRDIAVADNEQHGFCFDLDGRESFSSADNDPDNAYTVDAYSCGNWARFINHSCDPNLVVYLVVYDTIPEMNMPYVAFVATKLIPAGTELTVDYNPAATKTVRNAKRKGKKIPSIPDGAEICRCGARICRGWVRAA